MMTINDQIKDEKLQYNINREEAKLMEVNYTNMDILLMKIYYHQPNNK